MNKTLNEIAAWLSGASPVGDLSTRISRVHTDTRTLAPGDLFIAIKGDNFDANDFLAQAKEKGAVAAIAHGRASNGLDAAGLAGFEVSDTRRALGEIARAWRQVFVGPLVAVTGSNGKTTVTQMLASIFKAHAGEGAHATRDSFNNDIGLPLTLLALKAHHTHAAIEIGMNHHGEIDWLASLAQPTVALVNNAQREHQEFMGTVEAVAIENASVFDHVREGGVAVFPATDAHAPMWREKATLCGLKVMTFADGGDITGSGVWADGQFAISAQTPVGAASFTLALPGQHNVQNALAACACAIAAGLPLSAIERGLSDFKAAKGRSRVANMALNGNTLTLVDDSYNANPDSVRAAIDVLASLPKPRVLILGDMGEVGQQGPQFHAEIGAYAAQNHIDRLLTLGELAQHSTKAFAEHHGLHGTSAHFGEHFGEHFSEIHSLTDRVTQLMAGNESAPASVLVKGSRFMRMERVVAHIEQLAHPNPPTAERVHHAA